MTMTISPDAAACPHSEDIANRILCLPTYYTLALDDVKEIARNVVEIVNSVGLSL